MSSSFTSWGDRCIIYQRVEWGPSQAIACLFDASYQFLLFPGRSEGCYVEDRSKPKIEKVLICALANFIGFELIPNSPQSIQKLPKDYLRVNTI
jgi:hypothetical protein